VVELDREEGDFRVFSIELPPDIEERLLEEARERVLTELEQTEEETGERSHVLVQDEDLEIDWSDVPEDQVKREDVTPENFGRIAAQTAKQVITQRIREASCSRRETATTCSSTWARSRRCCPAPSRSTASVTSRARGSRPSSPRFAQGRRVRR
jgi:hypothetical protein